MKKIILILGLMALSGCCTEENYMRQLSSFIGQSEVNLVATLGHPRSMYLAEPYKSLEYFDQEKFCLSENKCELRWCQTQFFVKDGVVTNFNFKGNHCCAVDWNY